MKSREEKKRLSREDRRRIRENRRRDDFLNRTGSFSQKVLNARFQYTYETWLVAIPLLLLVLVPTVFRWTGLTDSVFRWLGSIRPPTYPEARTFDLVGKVRMLAGKVGDPVAVACWAVTAWLLFGFIWRKNYRLLWHPEMYFGLFTGYFVATAYIAVIGMVENWFGSLSLFGNSSILELPAQVVQTYRDFAASVLAELSVRTGIAISLPFSLPVISSKVIAMYIILYFVTNWLSVLAMQHSCQAEVYSLTDTGSVEQIGIRLGEGVDLSSDRAIPRNVKLYICSKSANFQISRHCVFVDRTANTGVMLHEMGHVAHKDAFAMSFLAPLAYAVPLLLWVLSLPFSLIPGIGQLVVVVLSLVNYMAVGTYKIYMLLTTFVQRQYESAADLYAVRFGYGKDLSGFLSRVDDNTGIRALLDPHPKSSTRVRRIDRWTEHIRPWNDPDNEWSTEKKKRKAERRAERLSKRRT